MKTSLLFILAFALGTPLFAAETKVLLVAKAESASATAPRVFEKAIINDAQVTADSIILADAGNALTCTGSVRITINGATATCERCKLELGVNAKVLFLNPEGVKVQKDAAPTLPELNLSLQQK